MRLKTLLMLTALSTVSHANPYNDLYVFGDSLLDTGNIYILPAFKFTNRIGPDYNTSPFGPISVELAAERMGLPAPVASSDGGKNYAVGGNTSQMVFESVTSPDGYIGSVVVQLPQNSYLQDINAGRQVVNPDALYIMDGGANDILLEVITTEAEAVVSANTLLAAADSLQAMGVQNLVMVNLPDIGVTPSVINTGDPQRISLLSSTFNAALQSGVQARGSNILLLDTNALANEVLSNPAEFGYGLTSSQITTSCFNPDNPAECVVSGTGAEINGPNPNPLVFFFDDGVHPSTSGQQIIGDYLVAMLTAPTELGLLPDMGLDDLATHWQSAKQVLRANRWHHDVPVGDFTIYGGYQRGEKDRDLLFDGAESFDKNTQYAVGLNYRLGTAWYVGGLVGRGENEMDFNSSASDFSMESYDFSLVSGYRSAMFFVDGLLSYGSYDYSSLKRRFALGTNNVRTEEGSTDGQAWGLSLTGGLDLFGGKKRWRLGPMLGYEYANVTVDGYTESGARSTTLILGDQQRIASDMMAGLFGDLSFSLCDCQLYGEFIHRNNTRSEAESIDMGLLTLPGTSANLASYDPEKLHNSYEVGFNLRLAKSIGINLNYGSQVNGTSGQWFGITLGGDI